MQKFMKFGLRYVSDMGKPLPKNRVSYPFQSAFDLKIFMHILTFHSQQDCVHFFTLNLTFFLAAFG